VHAIETLCDASSHPAQACTNGRRTLQPLNAYHAASCKASGVPVLIAYTSLGTREPESRHKDTFVVKIDVLCVFHGQHHEVCAAKDSASCMHCAHLIGMVSASVDHVARKSLKAATNLQFVCKRGTIVAQALTFVTTAQPPARVSNTIVLFQRFNRGSSSVDLVSMKAPLASCVVSNIARLCER
jgi:hypothetical protein